MSASLELLSDLFKSAREARGLSQEELAKSVNPSTNRSAIAHLEQGLRVPPAEVLAATCTFLQLPKKYWEPLGSPDVQQRLYFERVVSELVGRAVSLDGHDGTVVDSAEEQIGLLFDVLATEAQAYDRLNSVLAYYGVRKLSHAFFKRYLGPKSLGSPRAFEEAVRSFQSDAIRLFSTFDAAFEVMNSDERLELVLRPLQPYSDDVYRERTEWDEISPIEDERLPDLGYISVGRVKQEANDRQAVSKFLKDLAADIRANGKAAVGSVGEKKRRKYDSLLRSFGSKLPHGLLSPLFAPDADQLEREAEALAPKEQGDLARIEATQRTAQRNLAKYLAADHLDVYVATSMRTDADFVSVNSFVKSLFRHEEVRPLKLRYFNPTQSWIEDRVAKGLVEALMLRRASITVYMAQKEDTFGKDSEASVALGQGKPVVVFVPKLLATELGVDSETLWLGSRQGLQEVVSKEGAEDERDPDETLDTQALFSRVLEIRLGNAAGGDLSDVAKRHWADFDLYGEASRIQDEELRGVYRSWLDSVVKKGERTPLPDELRADFIRILVATTVNFEKRARIFREVHPLALQVILSTGVLNGILVVRSVESCARIVGQLVRNDLKLELKFDDYNYRLIEQLTGSTIRVISRHHLIGHAFDRHYRGVDL
ncbi:helix-turn-helix domain-containing protein [Corallococcus sp. AB011P]|uniref:helix-turn-helix domain-containing protein n=1 Tax=Corallococcus sp. AB011P TaxID=2316735 RepID=UPI00131592E7|nr:helix-turn-helix transcriptional regulator [Corallococcus sp. AB011P]